MKNTIIIIFSYVIAGIIILLVIGYNIETVASIPDNAVMYLNHKNKTYISPPCVQANNINPSLLERTTYVEVRILNYGPDSKCRDQYGFVEEGRSLTASYLEKIGILGPKKSRWSSDGSWNY